MKFYFCESCGKRITDKDIDSGEGKNKKLKGVYCKACAVDVMTMETLPLTEQAAREILRAEEEKHGGAATRRASRLQSRSASRMVPARGAGRRPTSASQARRGNPSNTLEVPEPAADYRYYLFGTLGLLVLCAGAFFLLSSGKAKPETQVRRSGRSKSTPIISKAGPEKELSAETFKTNTGSPLPPSTKPQPKSGSSRMEDLRESQAANNLKAAQDFYKAHPGAPRAYRDKLKALIRTYGTTKAGAEAAELIQQLNVPERMKPAPKEPAPADAASVEVKGEGEWKSLFDGSNKKAFAMNGPNWDLKNGVLEKTNRPEALLTRHVFQNDEVRIRFNVKNANTISFYILHSGPGRYGYIPGNSNEIQKMKGRTNELVFQCYGAQVEAFINGQQVRLKKIGNPSTKGQLQIRSKGPGLGIVSIETRKLIAATGSK